MPRNMIIRMGVDASDFQKKMAQAGVTAESTGKRIKKGLNINLSSEVSKIMGWSGAATGVGSINARNVDLARSQLGTLQTYRDQLAGAGFDDYQFGLVSERIKALEYDLNEYTQSLHETADAEQEATREAAELGQESQRSESFVSRMARALRSVGTSGRQANSTPSLFRRIRERADLSNLSINRMLRSIRNISIAGFAFRIAGAAFGEFQSIIRDYISQNPVLQAQVNGLRASLGQGLAPAIGIVTNALSALMPYVVGISNAFSSLMAALFGSGWSAAAGNANKTAAATGGAAKAQKELNRQLLSFDQITKMEGQKDASGGGGGGAGAAVTPIEAKTPVWAEKLKKTYTELFESAEFQAANVGGKIGMVLNVSIEEAVSALSNVNFTSIGSLLADNFNAAIGAVDWNTAGQLIGMAMVALPSTLVGFIQTTDWPLIGTSISEFLISSLSTVADWIISVDWLQIGSAIKTFLGNIDWGGITSEFSRGLGAALGAGIALLWELIKEPFATFGNRLQFHINRLGGDLWGGFGAAIGESLANVGSWLWDNFCKPIIDGVKEGFGIHSPSKAFGEIGTNCVNSLADRFGEGVGNVLQKITDLRDRVLGVSETLKSAFSFEWKMPHLRLPHLNVHWDPVDNVLANFFGVTAFPRLSVSWFAKGGILDGAQIFGRMGSTLLGGGERGREAILPLDTNTGWMDDIAHRIADTLGSQGGSDVNAVINVILDGEVITTYVLKGLRRRSRAGTASI